MDRKTHCVLMMQLGKKNVSVQLRMQSHFSPMTILIQKQEIHHPNQRHHLIKHPHFKLNTLLIMKKHPWKNLCWTMDIKKKFQKQSKSYISSAAAMNSINIYTYCLHNGQIYSNINLLVTKFMKIYKMPTVRHQSFLLMKISTFGIPKSTALVIIFRVFI